MVPTLAAPENNVSLEALVWVLLSGACCCFSTPIGYQTNMMVQDPGRYTFADFVRYGCPLHLIHGVITIVVCVILADESGLNNPHYDTINKSAKL